MMKLRLLCLVAALSVCAGVAQAADAGKKDGNDTGVKKLTIPSVEMGGGSLGVSTANPNDSQAPAVNDPDKPDNPIDPYFGLKFTKPLDGK